MAQPQPDKFEQGIVTSPDDVNFSEIVALYKSIFTLPEEAESEEGLKIILRNNTDSTLKEKFGPHEVFLPFVRDRATGSIVGGAIMLSSTVADGKSINNFNGTEHIYYIFVDDGYRSQGVGKLPLQLAEKHCRDLCREAPSGVEDPKIAVFCEQNAPLKMTPAKYLQDNQNAKMDQCDRLSWWQHQGFRRIGMNYTVPASSDINEPCDILTLNVKVPPETAISGDLVEFHLKRFFSICVLRGGDVQDSPLCLRVLFDAHSQPGLALHDDQAELPKLKERIYQKIDELTATGRIATDEKLETILATPSRQSGLEISGPQP